MKIAATQFKAHALGLIDRVAQSREEVVITKHGKPMAKLVPIEDDAVPPVFGYLAGLVTRDPRQKERKKYGQKGARKRFQFSKR